MTDKHAYIHGYDMANGMTYFGRREGNESLLAYNASKRKPVERKGVVTLEDAVTFPTASKNYLEMRESYIGRLRKLSKLTNPSEGKIPKITLNLEQVVAEYPVRGSEQPEPKTDKLKKL